MGNNTAHLKKRKEYKCAICEKAEHNPDIHVGNSVGDGGILGDNIAGGAGKLFDYLLTHPFYRYRKLKKGVSSQIQAHHLICSEAMDDEESSGEGEFTWEQMCNSFGYDINCKENGVNLPSCLEVACINCVPLHRGNHEATIGNGTNYVKSVIDMIEQSKGNPKRYCDNPKGFIDDMNGYSKKIFDLIKDFTWTITKDGKDYEESNPIGCLQCTSLPAKYKRKYELSKQGKVPMCNHSQHQGQILRSKHNLKIST